MAETMRAAVLYGLRDMRVENVPMPEIAEPDDVLIRVLSVGICGSDVHFFTRGRIGDFILQQPTIMGHESAGEVVDVGPAVADLRPGDIVAIEPGKTCRKCEFCKSGRYNLCPHVVFLAAPPVNGAFCECLVWPRDFVFKLPENLGPDEGAMMEPLSVGLHAVRLAGVRGGDTVAILGAGPIGLTTLMAAKAHGATRIIVTDVVAFRLDFATRLGATNVINARETDPVEAIMDLTRGRGVDAAFECAGTEVTIQQAMKVTRDGGSVQLVGMPAELMPQVPIYDVINRELTVRGTFRYANCYPAAIALASSGLADVKSLVTHHVDLDSVPEAMAWVEEHKNEVIKAVVHPSEGSV
ncbi:MAG: NAD(P)-dependent alcohol dehydrogenase [Armatimonadetes bacterium]|nr:NAD(P)-dependent alcohol dehydrogenase [Armatimonadota bacterium]